MEKKEMESGKKNFGMQAVVTIAVIFLAVGFVGGIVFSAFKMETGPPMSGMVATGSMEEGPSLTDEQTERTKALEKTAKSDPDNPESWIALGNACLDFGMNQQAIDAYETALTIAPNNANVCTDLGTAYRRNEEPEKAITLYEKAQEISPGHEMSLMNQGIVYLHDMDDPQGAVAAWEKLLEINPTAATSGGMMIKNLVETLKNPQ